jgi:hypothetical protein
MYYTKLAGGREGFMVLMFDAVYYPTTQVTPLPPHSPSVS